MPTALTQLVRTVVPEKTVVLFGAGSSVPSLAPTADQLAAKIAEKFKFENDGFSLDEICGIVVAEHSRQELIAVLKEALVNLQPTGGILNLPLYDWKSLFTTNYDRLVEKSYERSENKLRIVSSDFDFTLDANQTDTTLFKLHGTIEKDISNGDSSRIIITSDDYELTTNFREQLFYRLKGDLAGAHLLIIGQSLQDPDIKSIVNRAAEIAKSTGGAWKISLLMYVEDLHRAALFEKRGLTVCFAGIDEFFNELALANPTVKDEPDEGDMLSATSILRPTMDRGGSNCR